MSKALINDMRGQRKVWTRKQVEALGVRTTVPIAGEILAGLNRAESYRAARDGRLGVPVLQVGRRMVVPVQPILEALGLATAEGGGDALAS